MEKILCYLTDNLFDVYDYTKCTLNKGNSIYTLNITLGYDITFDIQLSSAFIRDSRIIEIELKIKDELSNSFIGKYLSS